jgi:hypothetical protein
VGLSDHDHFAIAHLAGDLSPDSHISRLCKTTTSNTKILLARLHHGYIHPAFSRHLSCSTSSPSSPTTTATGGNVFSREASRRVRSIGIAHAHCVEDTIQSPFSSKGLPMAIVFSVAIKSNDFFGLVLYQIHKIEVGSEGL